MPYNQPLSEALTEIESNLDSIAETAVLDGLDNQTAFRLGLEHAAYLVREYTGPDPLEVETITLVIPANRSGEPA